MIRAAVGISAEPNSTRAALDAAQQVLGQLDGQRPDWCIAFVTAEYRESTADMVEAVSRALDTPYVVGCTASGVLTHDRELERGPAIGILAVASDQMRGTPFMFHDAGDGGMTAGIQAGQRLVNSRESQDLLLLWPDPFRVRPDRLLQSLDAVLGNIPVVGGAASGGGENDPPLQFCGNECASGAVSGLRLGGQFRHSLGVTQGCHPLGEALRVTRAHENLILELEGRPAMELLRERAPAGMTKDMQRAMNFLFVGLLPDAGGDEVQPGEYLVRNIISADPDTGVVAISDRVDEGRRIIFAHREAISAERDLRDLLDRISPQRTGLNYRFGLYFNCLARGQSLYESEGVDSRLLAAALPEVPVLGFFCNAEFGPLRGVNQLLTYSGVLLLVAE